MRPTDLGSAFTPQHSTKGEGWWVGMRPSDPGGRHRIPQSLHIVGSYQGENVRSRPISETKHLWACSVLRWGTTRESQVTNVLVVPTGSACRFSVVLIVGS